MNITANAYDTFQFSVSITANAHDNSPVFHEYCC